MTTAHKITLALAVALACLAAYAGYGWVKEHEAGVVLTAQQKADTDAKATIAKTEADNQANLAATLKGLAALKAQGQTPAQIIKLAPQVLPALPTPINPVTAAQAEAVAGLPDAPQVHVGDLIIPAADVKPLYDAQVQCKVNAVTLTSCQETVTNQKAVMAVNDTEIKQQQTALKGGTFWHRAATAIKWTGIGIGIGGAVVAVVKH